MTPSAGVHPVYHTPTRQRNPLCAASLRTPAGVPRTLPTRPSPARTRSRAPTPPTSPAYPCAPATHSTPCLCDALCSMRQALGTEDAPSSVLTRLRMRMRCGSGSTGLRIEGMAELRDRADVPGSKLAFDVDRIDGSGSSSSDASTFVGSIARRMTDVDQPSMVPVFEIDLVVRGGDWSSAATRPVYGCGLSRGR
ncbi:hypothetical protein AVT14_gp91 [Mycobacterium phage Abrogate]|uniref:hypothetical protein n=1 Tax=Mycobacterium phage Abrogate TaxID=1551710 RepID=UPI00051A9EEE|nr:hypothetical protein AVT14_gp91 [Mycobacterium phage Abrogate]AIT13235.1 hypothetical protein PBI_ABROGATE_910 [Mycobacterium phage Abrogate]